jgi:hypothetical protein
MAQREKTLSQRHLSGPALELGRLHPVAPRPGRQRQPVMGDGTRQGQACLERPGRRHGDQAPRRPDRHRLRRRRQSLPPPRLHDRRGGREVLRPFQRPLPHCLLPSVFGAILVHHAEIAAEHYALRFLRGDFDNLTAPSKDKPQERANKAFRLFQW